MAINAARPEDDPTFRPAPQQAIPVDAPAPPRPQRPLPNRSAPPPMPPQQPAARSAPQQAIPSAGNDENSWIPPQEAERLNAAHMKELGKDYNPKRLATTEFLPEIARAVRTTVQSMFGIGGEGQAVPAERANINGYARSEGRASSQDVKAAKDAVDPENKLPPHLRSLAAFNGAYVFWNAQGDPKKAQAAIAEYALAAKHTLMQLGTLGQAAIEAGDMKALARILQDGYAEIPDGNYIEAKPKGKGLDVKLFDANGKLTEQGEMGMDMLTELVTGMQNGTVWLRSLAALEKRDEVDPKKQEADELAREAANTRNRATIAGGTSGASGRGGTAEERAENRFQQQLQSVQESDLPEEKKAEEITMLVLGRTYEQRAEKTRPKPETIELINEAYAEVLGKSWEERTPSQKDLLTDIATTIFRGSPGMGDPTRAARLAMLAMNPKSELSLTSEGMLSIDGFEAAVTPQIFRRIFEIREGQTNNRGAERLGAQPGAPDGAPPRPVRGALQDRDAQRARDEEKEKEGDRSRDKAAITGAKEQIERGRLVAEVLAAFPDADPREVNTMSIRDLRGTLNRRRATGNPSQRRQQAPEIGLE